MRRCFFSRGSSLSRLLVWLNLFFSTFPFYKLFFFTFESFLVVAIFVLAFFFSEILSHLSIFLQAWLWLSRHKGF